MLFRSLDLYALLKYRKIIFRDFFLTYLFPLLSLFMTFSYFNYHFFPAAYTSLQKYNVFDIPNFLSVVQIGLSLFLILTPFVVFSLGRIRLSTGLKILMVFLCLLSCASFIFPQKKNVGEGLGYISFLTDKMHLGITVISVISTLGYLFSLILVLQLNNEDKEFYLSYLFTFVTSSLLMPIPFLRYFQIPLILAIAFLFRNTHKFFTKNYDWHFFFVAISSVAMNLGSILFS